MTDDPLKGEQGIPGLPGIQGIQGEQGVDGFQGFQGVQGVQGTRGPDGTGPATLRLVDDRSVLRKNVNQLVWVAGAVLVMALITALVVVIAVLGRNSRLEDSLACVADRAAVDIGLGDSLRAQGEGKVMILNGLQGVVDSRPDDIKAALEDRVRVVKAIDASSAALQEAVAERSIRLNNCLGVAIPPPTTQEGNYNGEQIP